MPDACHTSVTDGPTFSWWSSLPIAGFVAMLEDVLMSFVFQFGRRKP